MKVREIDEVSWYVESERTQFVDGDVGEYLVWYNNGVFTCDCRGWIFYSPSQKNFWCKHVKEVMKWKMLKD